jgi:hypothetical protein
VSEAAPSITAPEPGSAAELATFRDLQLRLPDLFRKVFPGSACATHRGDHP